MYDRKTFLEWTVPYVLNKQFPPEKLEDLAEFWKEKGRKRVIVTGHSWIEGGKTFRGYIEYFPKTKTTETVVEEANSVNIYADILT